MKKLTDGELSRKLAKAQDEIHREIETRLEALRQEALRQGEGDQSLWLVFMATLGMYEGLARGIRMKTIETALFEGIDQEDCARMDKSAQNAADMMEKLVEIVPRDTKP